ncbi:MAG TPA: type II CAAX endopeptidase family protein [Candidatus Elarobacter sp.]|nr:type II CAAX endopeptidase family protein [Candidatus Elarobacter sp.]
MEEERSFATRTLSVVGLGLLAFAITILAGGIWTALLVTNLQSSPAVPWSVPAMALLLWLMWSYLGGRGWPRGTSEARRRCLRANRRSGRTYLWALVAGVLSVVALAGYWIVLFRLVKMPPNALPDVSSYPRMTVALMTLMGSLVAPFMEEAGFRGYFQVALERELRGPVAVMVSSLVFAFAHYAHGILWPKLLVYFLAGIAFGVTAYLTNSTLPAILPHMIGDLTFFTLVWPHDAARRLVLESGTDNWFWIHVAQAVVFTMLAVWAFQRLARVSSRDAPSEATNLELHKAAAS